MTDVSTIEANKVSELPNTQSQSVYQLDKVLSVQIHEYVKAHSWRKLSEEVRTFVNEQYKPAFKLVVEGKITPDALEFEIKSCRPSRSYIEAFAKGTAICYRYTNTLANFFEQRYAFKNFNPCEEFMIKIEDKETGNTPWTRRTNPA